MIIYKRFYGEEMMHFFVIPKGFVYSHFIKVLWNCHIENLQLKQ